MIQQPNTRWSRVLVVASCLAFLFPGLGGGADDVDLDQIISRCGRALGGSQGIQALRTLSFVRRNGDPKQDEYWEIRRPNLVRRTRPGRFILVFDGERAAYLKGPLRKDGSLGGPQILPDEHWPHFEIDIALYLPAFFDSPARYRGRATVNGVDTHSLEVSLPLGGTVVYWVDSESYLPIKVAVPAWELEHFFDDWAQVGGFMVPRTCRDPSKPEEIVHLDEVKVNGALGLDRFVMP